MIKRTMSILGLFACLMYFNTSQSQTVACNGVFHFEEKNGLLTIEMESGVINDNRWQIGSETETINGETRDTQYLYWTGLESFSVLSGAPIIYNIKINNPGTYRFAWRMRVGLGTKTGEHNDAWLKVDGEDFYGIKSGNKVYPKPYCNSDPAITCAAGSSTQNFIKAFGNRLDWGFVTNTNDHDSHRVFVTFNEAKEYTITVDARSSYLFIDRMVLRRSDVSDSVAFNLSNPESTCYDASLSVDENQAETLKIFPNPAVDKIEIKNLSFSTNLILTNTLGVVVKQIKVKEKSSLIIDVSDLQTGVYFISISDTNKQFTKKIIKL